MILHVSVYNRVQCAVQRSLTLHCALYTHQQALAKYAATRLK